MPQARLQRAELSGNDVRRLARRDSEAAEQLLQQGFAGFGRDLVEARAVTDAKQKLVAGREFVDEAKPERLASQPMVAVGDLGHVDVRAALRDMGLERLVGRVELAAEMLAALRRDLAQDRKGALEFARRHLL